ncbi:P-loop containing nucleoside triphosphate hydrolase protein [Cokeromyces recurvatus]|uniref:P-loop containing nucleoside triphosphate hydrolase protein n=1 Tax=Cokeromyces recurvatus TaxID=90255 RepID=UPI002220F02E|nr:P-loop containing nucleoside triphosphate hydrolase protein [Cokeromyces recurvatus]KAI7899541.1 P-loop containing nucleoside triphosphate hydrolase protein [Cokeromyces recurvatus]
MSLIKQVTKRQELGISASICQRLEKNFNILQPTLAQTQFIPLLLSGQKDVLLRDRPGTGKTLGIVATLASLVNRRSLFIVPNQELAFQIGRWLQMLTTADRFQILASHYHHDDDDDNNNTRLHMPPSLVIATPGCLLDLCNNRGLRLGPLDHLIIDEADQALGLPKRYAPKRDFERRARHPKATEVLLDLLVRDPNGQQQQQQQRPRHQTVMSSATLNRPFRHFVSRQRSWLLKDEHVFIDGCCCTNEETSPSRVVQHHCLVLSQHSIRNMRSKREEGKEEEDVMMEKVEKEEEEDVILDSMAVLQSLEHVQNGIFFIPTTQSISHVKTKLAEREVVVKDLKDYTPGAKGLWLATEFTARGIDIPNLSHVFLWGPPSSPASFLHIAGRTGRLGSSSDQSRKVISLVNSSTEAKIANMYRLLNIPVQTYEHVVE